ncbi:hypothetical protein GOODEAATRI_006875 [Goodea atripinnis]|uniref:Natural killer-tumor recognition protein n=1 Tax=Goodea atripinnis TaxID=208336 RepID=A0ABV0N8I6_9TELE
MSKTPPNRRGITFEVGAQLEARDSLKNWAPNRRDRRPQENGCPKNKRARRSTSDQEEDSNSEDEDQEEVVVNDKNPKLNGVPEAEHTTKQEKETSDQTDQNNPMDAEKGAGLTNGVKVEQEDEEMEGKCHVNGDVKKEEEESEQIVTKPYTESPKPYADMQSELSAQTEQDSVTTTTADSSGDVEQKSNVQSESVQPPADVPPPQPVKRKCLWKQFALQHP